MVEPRMKRSFIYPPWSGRTWNSFKIRAVKNTSCAKRTLPCLVVMLLSSMMTAQAQESSKASGTTTGRFCVCIDPGHPSEKNDGLEPTNGLREVSVNWEIALLLRRELEQDDFAVILTKTREDEFVTNEKRAEIANERAANLFLRLHADAGSSTGFTVYYPRREGTVRGVSGPSREILQRSSAAAKLFHEAFAEALRDKLRDNGIRGDEETLIGSKQGALTGSIFSKVPTVLVEMVFLTNPKDAEWIKQSSNKVAMAKAVAIGVRAIRTKDQDN